MRFPLRIAEKSMKLNDWQQVNRLCYSKSFTVGGKKLCFSYPDPVLYFLQGTEYYSLSRREIRSNNDVTDVKKILAVSHKNCFDAISLCKLMKNKKTMFFRLAEEKKWNCYNTRCLNTYLYNRILKVVIIFQQSPLNIILFRDLPKICIKLTNSDDCARAAMIIHHMNTHSGDFQRRNYTS